MVDWLIGWFVVVGWFVGGWGRGGGWGMVEAAEESCTAQDKNINLLTLTRFTTRITSTLMKTTETCSIKKFVREARLP